METVEIIQDSELAIAARKINTGVSVFESKKAELIKLAESAQGIEVTSIDDKLALKQVSEKRKELKAARIEIEKQGKDMRDGLTKISREISAKEKELVALIEPTELELLRQEKWVEAEKERIRQEEIAREEARIQSRINALAEFGFQIDYADIKAMTDETFSKYLEAARIQYEKEQAVKAEAERIRSEQEEAERVRREEEQKRIEAERKELEELRAKQAEAQRIIDEQNKKIEEEKQRIEAEKKAIEAARLREEEEKKRAEELRIAREKAAEEARIKAIQDAKEAEEKKAEQLRRKEARRPDKEKLIAFAGKLSTIVDFQVKSEEANIILNGVNEMIEKMRQYILQKSETL